MNAATLQQRILAELQPFGAYLAMKGAKEGEQRFGVPELTVAAILVAAWMAKQYLKGYLDEKGKIDAKGREEGEGIKVIQKQLDELVEQVNQQNKTLAEIEALWNAATASLRDDHLAARYARSPDASELLALLRSTGLTERAARKVADRLRSTLMECERR